MSKKIDQVLQHLKTYGSITPLEALNRYHYYRLSDGIMKLRKRGYKIETKEEYHGEDKYARYELDITEEVTEESAA